MKKDVKIFSRIFKSKNFLIVPKYAYFEFKRAQPGTAPVDLNQDHIAYMEKFHIAGSFARFLCENFFFFLAELLPSRSETIRISPNGLKSRNNIIYYK